MRPLTALRLGTVLAFCLGSFTVIASLIFLIGTGLIGDFAHPFWQWWLYLFMMSENPTVRYWLVASAIPAAVLPLVGGLTVVIRGRRVYGRTLRRDHPAAKPVAGPIRSPTDNHGHARWMTLAETRDLWPGPDLEFGGVVVGEAYAVHEDPVAAVRFRPRDPKTWGQGGKAPLLVDPCEQGSTHSLVIAGSGSYKTTSAVSTLLTWTGSAVVLDPSTELGPMLRQAREAIGHRVFGLEPRTADQVAFNVLDWIDTTAPMAETDVGHVVDWICGESPTGDSKKEFFKSRGKAMVTCLLAHMLWDDTLTPEMKTLRTLRTAIAVSEHDMRALLAHIHRFSRSRLARDLAGGLRDLVAQTFSGIYATADEDTSWLSTTALASLVSGSAFRSADIVAGKTTVFVCLPLKVLKTVPAIGRVIMGALLNAAYEADGAVQGRILYLIDEAALLGPMSFMTTARDAGRKYGITLQLLYQSVGQIIRQWGAEGKREWYEVASWRTYAAVKDEETARELAGTVGEYGVLSWTESDNTGRHAKGLEPASRSAGQTRSYHELRRQLIRPEEIMHDMREDEQIIVPKTGRPLRCGRAIYFRRPELTARVKPSRFFSWGKGSRAQFETAEIPVRVMASDVLPVPDAAADRDAGTDAAAASTTAGERAIHFQPARRRVYL